MARECNAAHSPGETRMLLPEKQESSRWRKYTPSNIAIAKEMKARRANFYPRLPLTLLQC